MGSLLIVNSVISKKPAIQGVLDRVVANKVVGWVANPFREAPIEVQLVVDGELRQSQLADIPRPGVLERGLHPTGNCGFEFELPFDRLLAKGNRVEVKADNTELYIRNSPWRYADGRIFFMHIAKTAGSKLNRFLVNQFPEDRAIVHVENQLFGPSPAIAPNYDFISGHVRAPTARHYLGLEDFFWTTVLREPYAQLSSHLSWIRHIGRFPDGDFFKSHTQPVRKIAQQIQAVDFSDPVAISRYISDSEFTLNLLDNCQTRYFLPQGRTSMLSASDLTLAKAELNRFDLIGKTEALGSYLKKLSGQFGFVEPDLEERVNVQSDRFGLDVKDPSVREILFPHVQHDLVLYQCF